MSVYFPSLLAAKRYNKARKPKMEYDDGYNDINPHFDINEVRNMVSEVITSLERIKQELLDEQDDRTLEILSKGNLLLEELKTESKFNDYLFSRYRSWMCLLCPMLNKDEEGEFGFGGDWWKQ